MSDLQFLEEMYQAGAAPYFDLLSANAFGMDRPPEDPPSPGTLNFRRIALQREIMERYGDRDKPVWFNEYGWNAAPDSFPEQDLYWKRVSEEEQALYTVQGIKVRATKLAVGRRLFCVVLSAGGRHSSPRGRLLFSDGRRGLYSAAGLLCDPGSGRL